VLAVSYTTIEMTEEDDSAIEGHGSISRLAQTIRNSRLVGFRATEEIVLWLDDENKNDKIELSELGVAWYDDANDKLVWSKAFNANTPAATIAAANREVTFAEFRSAAAVTAVTASAEASKSTYANDVIGVSFTANAADADVNVVNMMVGVRTANQAKRYVSSAAPMAPADYLVVAGRGTDDGNPAKRQRRVTRREWVVP
jgi:hypothetical protein